MNARGARRKASGPLSLWHRLYFGVALSTLTGLALFFGGAALVQRSYQEQLFYNISKNLASLGASSVSAAAVFENAQTADAILTDFAVLPPLVSVSVRLRDGRELASWERAAWVEKREAGLVILPRAPRPDTAVTLAANRDVFVARAPIIVDGERYGELVGYLSREVLSGNQAELRLFVVLAAFAALLLALLAARLLQRFVAAPILEISRGMRRVAEQGDYSGRVAYLGHDPLGNVADAFNVMTRRIAQREDSLRAARLSAEEAARAKQVFLANMSHEMRTPMNVIIGGLHLAEKKDPTPELRSLLVTARQAAETLLDLINDVLDLSKIEAGHSDVAAAPIRLEEELSRLRELLALRARQKKLAFYVAVDQEAACTVVVDGQKLMQILTNLTANAIKYTEAGEVGVEVKRLSGSTETGMFRFLVRDTGIGIDAETQEHLFDPFYQAQAARDKRYQGTGLGLSISQRLAGLLGSRIQVESEPGLGSSFWFDLELPVLDGPGETAGRDPVAQHADALAMKVAGARLLLVEDTKTSRLILRGLLEAAGAAVTEAADGYEAIQQACDGSSYDAILMDIQMPGMDGLEAARRIREHYAATGHGAPPPIIALTAYAYEEDRRHFLDAGLDGYLSKPVAPEALMRELARHLGRAGPVP